MWFRVLVTDVCCPTLVVCVFFLSSFDLQSCYESYKATQIFTATLIKEGIENSEVSNMHHAYASELGMMRQQSGPWAFGARWVTRGLVPQLKGSRLCVWLTWHQWCVLLVLSCNQPRIRNESLRFLEGPILWTKGTNEEIFSVVKAVVGRLRDVETEVLQTACKVLSTSPQFVGDSEFDTHISHLPAMLRQLYESVNKVCWLD